MSTDIKQIVPPGQLPSFWVFLTVPHAKCPSGGLDRFHFCDKLAPEAALCIHEESPSILNSKVKVLRPFFADTPRTVCDLNRRYCDMDKREVDARNHLYRRGIRDFVIGYSRNVQFVLDVHSYPPDHEPWMDYTLVVLDDGFSAASYSVDLAKFMNDAGVRTLLQRGRDNDIHVEMRELGKKSVLLEFNETLLSNRSELRSICRSLVIWFNRLTN